MVRLLQVNQKRPELARMNAEEEEEPGIKAEVERCVALNDILNNAALNPPWGRGVQRCCSDALWWQPFLQPISNRLSSPVRWRALCTPELLLEALPCVAMYHPKLFCTAAAAIMMTCWVIAGPGGWSGGVGPTLTSSNLAPSTGRPKSCASGWAALGHLCCTTMRHRCPCYRASQLACGPCTPMRHRCPFYRASQLACGPCTRSVRCWALKQGL